MTLSEFKGWFEERTNNIFKEYRYVTMSDINLIKEKLASVEDEQKIKQCEDCNEPLYPAPGASKCLACYETCMAMEGAANVPRGTLPEIAPVVDLCHYCKETLKLITPHRYPVCSVCLLHQP